MNIFKKIFKKKTTKDYIDPQTGKVTKSAIIYNKQNDRLLSLNNDTCALVLHPGGKVEVIFTRLYDIENQQITDEEETLMVLAMFMRQPGFIEMLRTTFHDIAMKNVSSIVGDKHE